MIPDVFTVRVFMAGAVLAAIMLASLGVVALASIDTNAGEL